MISEEGFVKAALQTVLTKETIEDGTDAGPLGGEQPRWPVVRQRAAYPVSDIALSHVAGLRWLMVDRAPFFCSIAAAGSSW